VQQFGAISDQHVAAIEYCYGELSEVHGAAGALPNAIMAEFLHS
jgi:hypothetical protein